MVGGAFADLAGQDAVVAQLGQAADAAARLLAGEPRAAGGMTHAWLFTGPPGSGRSVAARAFAAALLCRDGGGGAGHDQPGRDQPGRDQHCAACRQVHAGTHADLMVVRPDGLSYGVKQTRELVLRAAGAPSGGRWRIVLFEDADRCTEQAANALLKAIEEPAPRT
ncbi:MAG TPA: hypothetical protein VH089_29210, partial [Streptosporangiaceae bacterium]|nr:hypothetical protein [Streptosporangiaceae bacterium]